MEDRLHFEPRGPQIERAALLERILGGTETIVVIEAPAGMGKSTLLGQLARLHGWPIDSGADLPPADGARPLLWDIPTDVDLVRLPEAWLRGAAKIVLAKRPEVRIAGLERAIVYGRACVIGAGDLLFQLDELATHFPRARARRVLEATGGWPVLLPLARRDGPDGGALQGLLENELLAPMATDAFVELGEAMAGREPGPDSDARLVPLFRRDDAGRMAFTAKGLEEPLRHAYHAVALRRAAEPAEAARLAAALVGRGRVTEAIATLQAGGQHGLALDILRRAGGFFYLYRYGVGAFDTVLGGFPADFASNDDTLSICAALQALKRGDVARARQLISECFGPAASDPAVVLADADSYSLQFRFFRLLMLIYEDVVITDELFTQIFGLVGELPADANIERGCFYNAVLELYLRRRRLAEAEDVAARAHGYYDAAGVPMLKFYINVDRSIMRLMQGDAIGARRFAAMAGGDLAACGFESPNDARLHALLQASVEYEGGRVEPLARFLNVEIDGFARGEIWPTLIDFALQYGSQALSEHFSTAAARSFLDRWRVYQAHNRQFQAMIDIREAVILQNGNRWQEAADTLAAIASPVTRAFMAVATAELGRLGDRDDIALALSWLRHFSFECPTAPLLEAQLGEMLNNLHITGRQEICLEIWLAYVCKHRRNLSKARAVLQKALEHAARMGALGPLTEERYFLTEMLGNQRFRDFIQTSAPIRQVLRRLGEIGIAGSPLGAAYGLSRRETKVLLMISEGGSNKFIAHALGLSEVTVKYHLGNVYRKLGCKKRRDAIGAARAIGLVS